MKQKRSVGARKESTIIAGERIRIYTDGSGARLNGEGSGFAWFREDTGESHVEFVGGLTNNQAEYKAILSALESVPTGNRVEILCDSQLSFASSWVNTASWTPIWPIWQT